MRLWQRARTLVATRWSQALAVVALIVIAMPALSLGLLGQLAGATLLFALCGAVFWHDWRSPFVAREDALHRALVAVVALAPAAATVLAALALLQLLHTQLNGLGPALVWCYGLLVGNIAGRLLLALLRWRRGDPNALPPYMKYLGFYAALAGMFVPLPSLFATAQRGEVLLVPALLGSVCALVMPFRLRPAWYEPLLTTYASVAIFANLGVLIVPPLLLTYFNGGGASWLTLVAALSIGAGAQTPAAWLIERRMQRHVEERVLFNLPRNLLALDALWVTPEGLLWGADPAEIPLCYVARMSDGTSAMYVRADLPGVVRARLAALSPDRVLSDHEAARAALAEDGPSDEVSAGTTYTFPHALAVHDEANVELLSPGSQDYASAAASVEALTGYSVSPPIFAVFADDRMVATCTASASTDVVAEACLQVLRGYRSQRFAGAVLAVWAREMRRRGKVPLFSHERHDAGLAAIAQDLGLVPVADDVTYF